MTIEYKQVPPEERHKLHPLGNEEEMTRILESGTDEELEQLREHHGLDSDQIDLIRRFAQMRKEVLQGVYADIDRRKTENPKATEEEMAMGCYVEHLEPQVRDIVSAMQAKGYSTTGSGFGGFGEFQWVGFEEQALTDFKPPAELVSWLDEQGVGLDIEPDNVTFQSPPEMNLEQLTEVWKRIEAALPDLGKSAEPSGFPVADTFREKQEILLAK
jgi:hypothetical protein